jgi:hypothetical protein
MSIGAHESNEAEQRGRGKIRTGTIDAHGQVTMTATQHHEDEDDLGTSAEGAREREVLLQRHGSH